MERIQVIGGGFRGMVQAYVARQCGYQVTLMESGIRLGGVLNCVHWNGFELDFGCHLFDNVDDQATSLMFAMAGGEQAFHPVNVRYASKAKSAPVEGVAIPSFQGLAKDEQARMLLDLVTAQANTAPEGASLEAVLRARFGSEIASVVIPMAAKMFAAPPSVIAASALDMGLFRRVRFLDDNVARVLKVIPALDDRLAVSSSAAPMEFHPDVRERSFRNFYPAKGGMGGFTTAATRELERIGVDIRLGAQIERLEPSGDGRGYVTHLVDGELCSADRVISTLAPDANERLFLNRQVLSELTWSVPMALVYFATNTAALTGLHYLHNFDERDLTFRASAPGLYGNQINANGMTYLCTELPTSREGKAWTETEAAVPLIWQELKAAGLVHSNAHYEDVHILRVPKSYSVGRVGHEGELEIVEAELSERYPAVQFSSDMAFAKSAILDEVMKTATEELGWRPGA